MISVMSTNRRKPTGEIAPCDPLHAWWYDRVNSGARFRVDLRDEMRDGLRETYLRLPLAAPGEKGQTFRELALYLYNRGIGARLCETLGAQGDPTHMMVSFGDVVDFLQSGCMQYRVPVTPPWGYPDLANLKSVASWEPLDTVLLPDNTRNLLQTVFDGIGALELGVALARSVSGQQTYWFSYRLLQAENSEKMSLLLHQIGWRLPAHTAIVMQSVDVGQSILGYPLGAPNPNIKFVIKDENEEEEEAVWRYNIQFYHDGKVFGSITWESANGWYDEEEMDVEDDGSYRCDLWLTQEDGGVWSIEPSTSPPFFEGGLTGLTAKDMVGILTDYDCPISLLVADFRRNGPEPLKALAGELEEMAE